MNNLPPIPTPPAHYWREFRHSFIPYIAFAAVFLAAVVLWNKRVAPSAIVGEAEAVRASLSSILPGTFVELNVDLLQPVQKGQVLGMIQSASTAEVRAAVAAAAADLEVLRARLIQDMERNKLSYQQLRLDWLQHKVSLAEARVELQHAENEYQRNYKMLQEKIVNEVVVEEWRSLRDVARTKVEEIGKLVTDLEAETERLRPPTGSQVEETPVSKAINAAILAQQKEIESSMDAVTLKAPMDGVVSAINKRVGEKTLPGEPVIVISALQSSRIIAYVRQPINTRLKPGAFVEVRSRAADRALARAKVLSIGTQMELLPPTLLSINSTTGTANIEYGLPMLVEIPKGLPLLPGEAVDINEVPE